jgi:hypothetical protein
MKLCPKCQKQFSDDANFCPVDAARLIPLDAASTAGPGADTLTARFELGERIGGSRTGAVHRAKDKQGGQAVAIKLVAPAVVALPGVAQRLERELKQLERVQSAGVAKLLASGKRTGAAGEETWVASELIDGAVTLAEAINARGPIPLDQAAHLIEVIGEALIEAAQVGVVHRDLAPKNVLFAGGDIKLINFSLPVPTTEKVPGVPEFVAPEQVDGKAVDQRSNLYNLGAVYYYVLTGQTVHAGSPEEVHRAHVNGSIRTPSSLAPVPANVEAVIMRALDRSPTKRFLTVRQFVDEVTRIARGEGPATTLPMGKAKPKAELVATLMGVNKGVVLGGQPAPAQNVGQSTVIGVSSGPQLGAQGGASAVGSGMAAPVVAPQPSTAPGVGLPALGSEPAPQPVASPAPAAQDPRSPWASPAQQPMPQPLQAQPAQQPMPQPLQAQPAQQPAAPVVAAPVVAAPQVSNPQVAATAAASSGKKGGKKDAFRETMWFKKGDLDAQAAVAAAEERARTGKETANDKADSLPTEDRYGDDGSISRGDKEKYSLRTGGTQMMSAIKASDLGASGSQGKVSEDALIGEMKGGRGKIFAAIAGVVFFIVAVIIFFVVR